MYTSAFVAISGYLLTYQLFDNLSLPTETLDQTFELEGAMLKNNPVRLSLYQHQSNLN